MQGRGVCTLRTQFNRQRDRTGLLCRDNGKSFGLGDGDDHLSQQ